MKIRIVTIIFSVLIIVGCSSTKEASQRRNFMMPEKSDLPRNSNYSESQKKKTYKVHKQKKKNRKKQF